MDMAGQRYENAGGAGSHVCDVHVRPWQDAECTCATTNKTATSRILMKHVGSPRITDTRGSINPPPSLV